MQAKNLFRLSKGVFFIMMFLAAVGCSGGVESNFSIDSEGFDFPVTEPAFVADETVSYDVPLADYIGLRIEGIRGDIDIEGRDGVDSISIIAKISVGADSYQDAEMHLNDLEILVADRIDELHIETVHSVLASGVRYRVDYTILLPSDIAIEASLVNGDITIINIRSNLMVDGQNGNVLLSNIVGSAMVNMGNGNIDGTMVLPLNGEIIMSIGNGDIDLYIPKISSADFSAAVTNGAIRAENLELEGAMQSQQSLTGTLGTGKGIIDLASVNGHITVVGLN